MHFISNITFMNKKTKNGFIKYKTKNKKHQDFFEVINYMKNIYNENIRISFNESIKSLAYTINKNAETINFIGGIECIDDDKKSSKYLIQNKDNIIVQDDNIQKLIHDLVKKYKRFSLETTKNNIIKIIIHDDHYLKRNEHILNLKKYEEKS